MAWVTQSIVVAKLESPYPQDKQVLPIGAVKPTIGQADGILLPTFTDLTFPSGTSQPAGMAYRPVRRVFIHRRHKTVVIGARRDLHHQLIAYEQLRAWLTGHQKSVIPLFIRLEVS